MKQSSILRKGRAIGTGLCCWLAALTTAANAGTYYVDFSAGNDANNGTDPGTPWQHCPGDNGATGTPSSVNLAPGDTVIFKGGVQYTNFPINLKWSGSPGNPITYDGNSAGTFGAGKAVFNANNSTNSAARQNYGFYASTTQSNLVINNVEMEDFGGHGAIPLLASNNVCYLGYAIYLTGCHDVAVENCYLHDMGDFTNAPYMNQTFMEGIGVAIEVCGYNIVVTNCEFTHIGRSAIQVQTTAPAGSINTATNITITGCNFHDFVRWSVDLCAGANGSTVRGIVITNCQIHDIDQYATSGWVGIAGGFPHGDGIIMRQGGTSTNLNLGTPSQPIVICGCMFYQCATNIPNMGTAMIFLTTWGGTVQIYNNLFINALFGGEGSIYCQDGTPLNSTPVDYLFANNTFYDSTYMVYLRTVSKPLTQWALTNGTTRIKNNIFYKTDAGAAFQVVSSGDAGYSNPTELDYNYYVTARADKVIASLSSNGVAAPCTLANLQANGYEIHGYCGTGNPGLANVSHGFGAQTPLNDLHLQFSSPAIGAGTNLSPIFTFDKDVHQRVTASNWDIGAYTFRSPVAAPSQLRVVGP